MHWIHRNKSTSSPDYYRCLSFNSHLILSLKCKLYYEELILPEKTLEKLLESKSRISLNDVMDTCAKYNYVLAEF